VCLPRTFQVIIVTGGLLWIVTAVLIVKIPHHPDTARPGQAAYNPNRFSTAADNAKPSFNPPDTVAAAAAV
jgi:hypothetical protein